MQPGKRAGQLSSCLSDYKYSRENEQDRTACAKRGTMSPRPPTWFLWERVFPSDYKCIRENEQDNWSVVLLVFLVASCPARFPCCICSPMEKRVPTDLSTVIDQVLVGEREGKLMFDNLLRLM